MMDEHANENQGLAARVTGGNCFDFSSAFRAGVAAICKDLRDKSSLCNPSCHGHLEVRDNDRTEDVR